MKFHAGLLLLLVVTPNLLLAGSKNHKFQDEDYNKAICRSLNGLTQVKLGAYGRADCVTEKFAIETEFADLWKEGRSQVMRYAHATGKAPLLALIVEDEKDLAIASVAKSQIGDGIQVKIFKTEEIAHLLPKKPVCAKLSSSGGRKICHLFNTGAFAQTQKFEAFPSYASCIRAGGVKPKNVGEELLIRRAAEAFERGICESKHLGLTDGPQRGTRATTVSTKLKFRLCERICRTGKACGNSCIPRSNICRKPRGNTCDAHPRASMQEYLDQL